MLVGKTLLLNGRNYTVIGVMPAALNFRSRFNGVQGNQFAERVDIWKPIAFTPEELKQRGNRSYGVIARLRPGMSLTQAQAELDSNHLELGPDLPGQLRRRRFRRENLSAARSGGRPNAKRLRDFARRGRFRSC